MHKMTHQHYNARLIVASFAVILSCFRISEALVISPPVPFGNQGMTIPSKEDAGNQLIGGNIGLAQTRKRGVRIRSMREADISNVAQILASSLLDQADHSNGMTIATHFKAKLELLKTIGGVESLLRSRIHAIEFAKKVQFPHLVYSPEEINETDGLRHVWSNNDSFRKKIELAANLSNEPHIWKCHNFACAPGNGRWLQHKMLTAVDATSGDIVGFCEIAMISKPSSLSSSSTIFQEDENDSMDYAPTVMNLATCPQHRRRGIATRLIHAASRFVEREWKESIELSLYVEQDNEAAIALYQNLGFGSQQAVERDDSHQYYMAKALMVPSFA